MYQPPHFREDRLDAHHAFIRAHPLGLLVTVGTEGPSANAIPFLLAANRGPKGTLHAHLARANPQLRELRETGSALVVFQGTDAYISPSWYPTKRATGKVVPTWNYVVVQARGPAQLHDDPDWLHRHVTELTEAHERHRAEPWSTGDPPQTYIDAQLKGIVGLEIGIERLEGKWKASQNRTAADREGVAEGLEREASDGRARAMAALVRERGGGPGRTS